MRRKKQPTKRDRKAERDIVLDTVDLLALGMKRMLSSPDGFMAEHVFLPCGDPGSHMWGMSISRPWQTGALAVLTAMGALSLSKGDGGPVGFSVVRPDILQVLLEDVALGDVQRAQSIIHMALNPPKAAVQAAPPETENYMARYSLHSMPKNRPLLGVSNQFTEFVVSCMHEAGIPYPVDQHELASRTGLTEPQLVSLLQDHIGSMDHLYALFGALPKVRSFFVRRPATDEGMRRSWECSADFARHREREGTTREQQAAFIGMSVEDLERLERGEFSPSIDEYERIVKIPEFHGRSLAIGVPTLSWALQAFMDKSRWRQRHLASQSRIPSERVAAILKGARPNPDEWKRLLTLIPGLPQWRRYPDSPPPVPSPVQPPVPETTRRTDPDADPDPEPGPAVEPDPVEPGRGSTVMVAAAHEHPALTESERTKVQLAEDALLRLSSGSPCKRSELFPGDSYDPSPHSWQPAFLQKLSGADVVVRTGERNRTKYRGVRERVDALLGDTDWLLRLVVPAVLSRTVPETAVEGPHEESSEDAVVPEFSPDEPEFGHDKDPSAATEFLSEAQRLLPDFFKILQYQHDRIAALESTLSVVNSKLDSVLAHLKGGPDDPA